MTCKAERHEPGYYTLVIKSRYASGPPHDSVVGVYAYFLTGTKKGNKWFQTYKGDTPQRELWPLMWTCVPTPDELKSHKEEINGTILETLVSKHTTMDEAFDHLESLTGQTFERT